MQGAGFPNSIFFFFSENDHVESDSMKRKVCTTNSGVVGDWPRDGIRVKFQNFQNTIKLYAMTKNTIITLNTGTDRPEQTV